MTVLHFATFDHLEAPVTDDNGSVVATTTRSRRGSSFEVHRADGSVLCTGRKPRRMTRKHEVLDGTGRIVAVLASHAAIQQDIDLLDGRTWTLKGTLTDRTWSVRDDASGKVVISSTTLGASRWSLAWRVTGPDDIDLALLIGIVETHHILEANRPTKAQEQASLDTMGRGGPV